MAKVKVVVQEEAGPEEPSPLLDAARNLLMAGMGAAALAQEEVEGFVHKLVERGEIAQNEGRKLAREIVETRTRQAKKAERKMDRRIEETLSRLNLPTRSDIESLHAQIAALAEKIDELKPS
jgi:poly(hydroxyalkanoate) granule-associated protein